MHHSALVTGFGLSGWIARANLVLSSEVLVSAKMQFWDQYHKHEAVIAFGEDSWSLYSHLCPMEIAWEERKASKTVSLN